MGRYRFLSQWQVDAPAERVWDAISDSLRWPSWWKGVLSVEQLDEGDDDGLGDRRRYVFRSRLPYRLAFELEVTRSERHSLLEGRATGELEGTGTWTFLERDGGTLVTYLWAVHTTRRWMDLPIPFARKVFESNHDVIMGWGAEGLARELRVRVDDRSKGARVAERG